MKKIDEIPLLKETLKQKIQLKTQCIRRYRKRTKFNRQNNIFKLEKRSFTKNWEKASEC